MRAFPRIQFIAYTGATSRVGERESARGSWSLCPRHLRPVPDSWRPVDGRDGGDWGQSALRRHQATLRAAGSRAPERRGTPRCRASRSPLGARRQRRARLPRELSNQGVRQEPRQDVTPQKNHCRAVSQSSQIIVDDGRRRARRERSMHAPGLRVLTVLCAERKDHVAGSRRAPAPLQQGSFSSASLRRPRRRTSVSFFTLRLRLGPRTACARVGRRRAGRAASIYTARRASPMLQARMEPDPFHRFERWLCHPRFFKAVLLLALALAACRGGVLARLDAMYGPRSGYMVSAPRARRACGWRDTAPAGPGRRRSSGGSRRPRRGTATPSRRCRWERDRASARCGSGPDAS